MGMTTIWSPTRTLYAEWTTRVAPIVVETQVLTLRPSTVTNVVTTCLYGGDGNCWLATVTTTRRAQLTEYVTTQTRTVTGSPSVSTVSFPTATLFATTQVPLSAASSVLSGMESASGPSGASLTTRTVTSSFSLPETTSKTLVAEGDLPGATDPSDGASSQRLRIAAIVGGLIGGFLTPILLVFLFRYLLKRRRIRGGGSGFFSPPMRSNASFAPSRALSPTATLVRSPTLSEGGHLAPGGVDRRVSRTSRASRITHDPRSYPNSSPSGSSHGHGPVSSHGHDPVGSAPARRPSVVRYAPDPVLRAASPSRIRTPSPVLHRNGTINTVPPVPPVPYLPPMAYDPPNSMSYPVSVPPPTFAPLASVAEGSPPASATPMHPDQPIDLADVPPSPQKPSTERTRSSPDISRTNS